MELKIFAYNLGYITTVVITLLFGFFIFLQNRKSPVNKNFLWMNVFIAIFAASMAIAPNLKDEKLAYMVFMANLANIFIALFYVKWILSFLGKLEIKKNIIKIFSIIGISLFSLCLIFNDLFLPRVLPKMYFNYYLDGGPLYILMVIYFFALTIYGFCELLKTRKTADQEMRKKINNLIFIGLMGYSIGSFAFLLVFNIEVDPFFTGYFGLFTVPLIYSVFRYRLMDIKIVARKAFFYFLCIFLFNIFSFLFIYSHDWLEQVMPGFQIFALPIFIITATVFIGILFWNKTKEVEKMKYEFITIAAHKLRTPLTEIKWAGETLLDSAFNEKDREKLVKGILAADGRLIELTNELLDLARADAAAYQYKLEKTDLTRVVKEAINSFVDQIKNKKIKLSLHLEKNIPEIEIDKIRISFVISRLLENAIFYTKNRIDISIDIYKNNLVFHIEDNGIGASKEEQRYIFSKFYRTNQAYLSETEGAGISLYLAKKIIEKHGGKIGVRSEGKGKGSIFWFGLPF